MAVNRRNINKILDNNYIQISEETGGMNEYYFTKARN